MKMKQKLSIILFFIFLDFVACGSYLFFFPYGSKSHKIAYMSLASELASKGYEVTIVTPFEAKTPTPGITEIINKSQFEKLTTHISNHLIVNGNGEMPFFEMLAVAEETNENALSHPEVQRLISSGKTFDVVMVFPALSSEAGYVLANKFNSSLVLFASTVSSFPWCNWAMGSPHNPAYIPTVVLPYTSNMNFIERFVNTVVTAVGTFIVREWFILPAAQRVIQKVFPEDPVVDLKEIESKASLMITFGNPFLGDGLRPILPNQILAGFMGCQPANKLPKDIQEWIDGAEHGVIYVSFGSVVKAHVMPDTKRNAFIKVLGQLKQRVIWKWDGNLPQQPANVLTSTWLPQKDILAHEKVLLFVTHGGAGSILETICYKTPILGIPIMGDQITNLFEAEAKGFARVIQWNDVDEASLEEGINTMMNDDSYQVAINKLGDLVLDQPIHPLYHATWWMEYIVRHPGNVAMRSPVHDLAWHQYFLLDVLLVLVGGVVVTLIGILALGRCCWRRSRKTKTKNE